MFKKASRGTNLGTGIRAHFLGATHSVTGSFHYFEYEYRGKVTRFALDAGMLQEDESENFRRRLPKGTKASDLDFVIFSHAHIDHIGYFPKLWKDGFRGKAFATAATRDLMHLLLPDSGKIQEIHAEEAAQSKEPNKSPDGSSVHASGRGRLSQAGQWNSLQSAIQPVQKRHGRIPAIVSPSRCGCCGG